MFDLQHRVALVTGAGQGVGSGIAASLAAQGAVVAINDLHPGRAEACMATIEANGGRACVAAFDVTDPEAVAAGVATVVSTYGRLDILVNNAGIPDTFAVGPFAASRREQWDALIAVNLYGVLHCSHAVIGGMVERGFGRIITISSGAGTTGLAIGVSLYAAGKGGAISFMRHLALENAAHGVTVNTIALGLMDTQKDRTVTEKLARSVPVRRLGLPSDAGALCVYLASDEAAWFTGQTVELNGGSTTT